jgi:hypothetical protein
MDKISLSNVKSGQHGMIFWSNVLKLLNVIADSLRTFVAAGPLAGLVFLMIKVRAVFNIYSSCSWRGFWVNKQILTLRKVKP